MVYGYNDYQEVVQAAQNKSNGVKVGFFKLADDGAEALVRFNVSSVDDLQFATVHTIQANGKWLKINCLNPIGNYSNNCPLCAATNEGNTNIGKASKKVYLQMLVSYKDRASGQWSAPQPVIWERPASFSRDIANKIRDYGDLKQVLLKVTRNGKAGDMKTSYSLDYAVPTIFKPEMIPADFSAFNNFNVAKHSYWEKTVDEIRTFLQTGSFPEVASKANSTPTTAAKANDLPYTEFTASQASVNNTVFSQANVETPEVAPAPAQTTTRTQTSKFNF